MIAKYRNRALWQILIAVILSVSLVLVFKRAQSTRYSQDNTNWLCVALLLYLASYAMWVIASLTLARARGYQRDAMGAIFVVCYILGFCIPILPLLFPFFIIFGLDDKTKGMRRGR
jgi:hypothetical protein